MKKITRILCISAFLLSSLFQGILAKGGNQNFFNSKLSSYSPELNLMSYLGSGYEAYSSSTSAEAMACANANRNAVSADTFYKALFFDGAYCVPTYEYTGDYLSAISTTGAIQNITYTATGPPPGNYVNNSNQIIRQAAGLAISFSTTYVGGTNGVGIWVDWNDDGVFDDTAGSVERVFLETSGAATKTGTLVIPAATPLGEYRVRVRSRWNNPPTPCGQLSHGSAVDYTLDVIEPPACLPPTALSATALSLTSMQLGWTSTGNNFQVEWGAAGFTLGTGTTINNLTTTTTTVTTIIDTPYEFYVRRNCGADGFSYWSGPFAFKTGYCIPTYTWGCSGGAKISNFVTSGPFANISNNTGTSSCGVNGYNSFTAMTASSCVGVDIDFSVSVGSYSGGVKVWIDWNGNGEFEASELQYQSTGSVTSGTSANGTIVVPAGTAIGNYRMRVRVVEGETSFGPCTSQSYGEVEDYTFSVIAAPACMPPSNLRATALLLNSVELGWVSSGTNFEVQWGAAGFALGSGTLVNGLTTPTTTVSVMADTPYEFYVRRNCGVDGFSTWSGPFAFKTGYCIPTYTWGCNSGSKVANFVTSGIFSNISNNTGTSSCGVDGYNDFSEMTVSSFPGLDVPSSVTVGSYSGGVKVWVDWNGNGEFETGELQYQSTSTVSSNNSVNGNLVVPAGTVPGDYRLRVRVVEGETSFGPCTSQSYGEVEDYTFTVLEVPACVYPINVRVGSFSTTEAEILWGNLAGQDLLGIEYYLSTSDFGPGDGTPGEFLTGDVTSLALTDLTPDTTYYVWVRTKCTDTEYSDWSNAVSFTTIPLGQIGTGTTFAGTLPLSSNYNYNYSQQIYLASEIGNVLGTDHYITAIRFYVESLPATTDESTDWKVYMGNTTQAAFSGTSAWIPASQFSMVFNGAVTYPTEAGRWVTLTLDTPFLWDGTSNLAVGVNEYTAGKSAAPTMQFGTFSTGTAYRGMMIYTDASNPNTMSPQTASARYQYVNRIVLASETAPTCIAVPATIYSDLTINSVKLKWTNLPGYLGVEYYLSASNTPPTANTPATAYVEAPAEEVVISELQPETVYYVWFKNICSATENSGWSVHPLEFKTLTRGMIGVGETTSNQLPLYSTNSYNYSQQIYLQSELEAAFGGTTPQYITSLRFHINNTATIANIKDWKILMGNTPKSVFASTAASEWVAVADLQEVFDGVVTFPSPTNDWMIITLEDPFIWDGTSNIVVAVNEYTPGWSSGANFRKHDVTTNRGRIYTQDGSNFNLTSPANANSNLQYVPQVIFGTSTMPTCFPVSNIVLTDITRYGVTATWNLPFQAPGMGYEYEVRTSGQPGSGATGRVLMGNVTVGLQAVLAGLTPGTEYTVYIRSKCSATDFSPWRASSSFITLCAFPDVTVVAPAELCGVGTTQISANLIGNGNAYWFDSEQGGAPIHTGNIYVTEELEETTSFYVAGGAISPNLEVVVGEGTATASGTSNPFYSNWSNTHIQHLITAEDLIRFGMAAGPITSVALDVTNAGTFPMLGLSVKMGTTTATELTTFANTDAFVEVYTNASLMPVLGINTLNFAAPFIWDGTSNIVLQFCHGNPGSTATMSRTVKFNPTSYKSTIKTHITSSTGSEVICGNTTSNLETFEGRPQFIFNATGLCLNPDREEVTVVVNEAPAFELSETELVLCAGTPSQSVTILEGAADYDVYVWTPATGVTGNAQTGWIFNPAETTEYTLRASSSTEGNICKAKVMMEVTVNPIPEASFIVTETDWVVCEGAVLPAFGVELLDGGDPTEEILGEARTMSGTTDNNTVFNNRWPSGKSQMFYSVSELNELGMNVGTEIQAISFEIATLGDAATNANYTVKIGTTDLNEIGTAYITTGLTTVFGPVTYTHTATGWQEMVFDTPYVWDGVSNLIIEISMNGANDIYSSQTYYTTTTNNSLLYSINTSSPTRSKNRYNTKFKYLDAPKVRWTLSDNLYVDEDATVLYDGETDVLQVYYKGDVEGYETITGRVETALGCFIERAYTIRTAFMTPPEVPTAQEFCGAIPITEVEIDGQEGATFLWYTSATAETPLPANYRITATAIYYVTQKIGDCIYPDRTAVSILIKDKPINPVVTGGVVCGGSLLSQYTVGYNTNNTLHWYDADDNEIVDHNIPMVTGTYYVSQRNPLCESDKVQIEIAVNPFPASPVSERQLFCQETRVSDLAVELLPNGVANWYDSENSVIRLTSNTIVSSGTYYVSQTVDGCDSQRVAVVIEAYDRVPMVNAQNQNYCSAGNVVGDLVVSNVIEGATVSWYRVATGGTPINPAEVLTTGIYYVGQKVGSCESVRTRIGVTIVNNNTAPWASEVQEFCGSPVVWDLRATVATGMVVKWYAVETGGTPLLSHEPLTNGMYYASQTIYNCESPRTAVRVVLNEVPTAPTGEANQNFEVNDNARIADLVLDQNNIVWYSSIGDATNDRNRLATNMPLQNGYTYYAVRITAEGCRSEAFAVTVVIVDPTMGIEDFDLSKLNYYPNPVVDVLTISYSENIKTIEVYDMNSKLVLKQNYDDQVIQIDMSSVASGNYMIRILSSVNTQFIKVVKK